MFNTDWNTITVMLFALHWLNEYIIVLLSNMKTYHSALLTKSYRMVSFAQKFLATFGKMIVMFMLTDVSMEFIRFRHELIPSIRILFDQFSFSESTSTKLIPSWVGNNLSEFKIQICGCACNSNQFKVAIDIVIWIYLTNFKILLSEKFHAED